MGHGSGSAFQFSKNSESLFSTAKASLPQGGTPAWAFAPGPDRLNEAMMRWAVGEINRSKLLLGLSAIQIRVAGRRVHYG